jgi:glutamate-1-semialdehyde aminotransferase
LGGAKDKHGHPDPGLATLNLLRRRGTYEILGRKARRLVVGFKEILKQHRMSATLNRVGSMMTLQVRATRFEMTVSASKNSVGGLNNQTTRSSWQI